MGDEGDPGGLSMHHIMRHALAVLGVILVAPSLNAAESEQRVALVIGNAAYQQGALPTTANDAANAAGRRLRRSRRARSRRRYAAPHPARFHAEGRCF